MNFERQRTTVDTQPFAFHLGVLCVRQTHIAQIDRGAQSKWNDARITNPRSASKKNSPRSPVPKKCPSIGQRPIKAARAAIKAVGKYGQVIPLNQGVESRCLP